jgi:hypothetical protein
MGAKSSKAAVIIDPSKANIYDTFSNYQDDDFAIDYTKEFWYIQRVIMAFIIIFSLASYMIVYLRRRRTKYAYK